MWDLLAELVSRTRVNATLVERDQNFPDDFGDLLAEIDRARTVLRSRATGERAAAQSAGGA